LGAGEGGRVARPDSRQVAGGTKLGSKLPTAQKLGFLAAVAGCQRYEAADEFLMKKRD